MRNGKLNIQQLENLIYSNIKKYRNDILTMPQIGQDCGFFFSEDKIISVTSDPITATDKNMGKLAVIINLNDLATSFAEPIAITVTILSPPGTDEKSIYDIMKDISYECKKYNTQIIGGHTEITDAVNRTVVSITAIGKIDKNRFENIQAVRSGANIYISKQICLEGTMIICSEKRKELEKILTEEEFKEAENFSDSLSVLAEANALKDKNISIMHDITEGGLLGGIYEILRQLDMGCIIDYESIKINPVTKKVCSFYNIDPLRLLSSGSMIIISNEEIENNGQVEFTKIGEVTEKPDMLLKIKDKFVNIDQPDSDEIYKVV